ncbi:hypothetical protein BJY00DRAFT_84318 [Aspergillus carlsbadensis]|nr:hypothetical protein BJY00DRAFT_84318 [Aspergillus carlsbadensis]
MPDAPSDDQDSRIASLGAQRTRSTANSSAHSSRRTSREPPSKRQRRSRKTPTYDVQDFVPRGASFSANSLEVDPVTSPMGGSAEDSHSDEDDSSSTGESSSSGSSESESESDSDSDRDSASGKKDTRPNADANMGSAPVPNWNKTGKSVIRTSLRSRQPQTCMRTSTAPASAAAANNKRSASASSGGEPKGEEGRAAPAAEGKSNTQTLNPEEGEVDEDKAASTSLKLVVSDDSDDSESLDSEANDSIMLNTIGSRGQDWDQNGVISISDDGDDDYDPVNAMILGASSRNQGQIKNDAISISDDDSADDYNPEALSINGDDYDPEALPVLHTPASIRSIQNGSGDGAKEDAFARFAQKYPAAPLILADLDREDLETQAQTMFYDRDINDVNLQMPITCIECLREGHLAEVCPTKECVHCGAWNKHQCTLCPHWRRCQRCRERGHDQKQCPSALKSSANETPCDLCGSQDHTELDCGYLWQLPRPDTTAQPVLVSISCANCLSSRHLIGDCPTLTRPFITSTTFTLRGIDPEIITNINSVVGPRRGGGPSVPSGRQQGLKIRGRADQARSQSPDSDDMMSRGGKKGPIGGNRNANRGNINIRIGGNAGKNRNSGPPPLPPARDYRDREDAYSRNYNPRQRSMSPARDRRPGRGRGGWQPGPPRSPPRGQGRPPPPRPGRGGGGRGNGRGRGGGHRGGGDASYRPMPSAAKKAWDKYRL